MKVKDKEKLNNPLKGWRILSTISSMVFHTVHWRAFLRFISEPKTEQNAILIDIHLLLSSSIVCQPLENRTRRTHHKGHTSQYIIFASLYTKDRPPCFTPPLIVALIPSKETTTKEATASRSEGNIVPTQCPSKMLNINMNWSFESLWHMHNGNFEVKGLLFCIFSLVLISGCCCNLHTFISFFNQISC